MPTNSGMATIKLALMIAILASLSLCVANPSKIQHEAGGVAPEYAPSLATATRRYTLCIHTDACLCVYTYVCLCATATCAGTILAAIVFCPKFYVRTRMHACDRTTLNTFVGWFVQNREGNAQSAEERRQGHGNIAHRDMAAVHTKKGTTRDIIVTTSMCEAWKRDRSVLEKYKSRRQIIIDGFFFLDTTCVLQTGETRRRCFWARGCRAPTGSDH